jgi:hypothetical protein
MSIPIKREKRTSKIQQVIWLNPSTFRWILDLSEQLEEAPNTVIAKLLDWVKVKGESGELKPLATVDKIVKVYACPYCNFEAKVRGDLLQHLLDKHSDKLKIEGK